MQKVGAHDVMKIRTVTLVGCGEAQETQAQSIELWQSCGGIHVGGARIVKTRCHCSARDGGGRGPFPDGTHDPVEATADGETSRGDNDRVRFKRPSHADVPRREEALCAEGVGKHMAVGELE